MLVISTIDAKKAHTIVAWVHRHGFVEAMIAKHSKSRNNPIDKMDVTHNAR